MLYATHDSPIGLLRLTRNDEGLTGLYCEPHVGRAAPRPDWRRDEAAFREVTTQLDAYFGGDLVDFDLPLAPTGTPFQTQVWAVLRDVPYGTTTTYGAIASRLGRPLGAARAVGAANGRNPISIVVPCHRVVGATGAVVGYAGGVDRKRWLLAHERRDEALFR